MSIDIKKYYTITVFHIYFSIHSNEFVLLKRYSGEKTLSQVTLNKTYILVNVRIVLMFKHL